MESGEVRLSAVHRCSTHRGQVVRRQKGANTACNVRWSGGAGCSCRSEVRGGKSDTRPAADNVVGLSPSRGLADKSRQFSALRAGGTQAASGLQTRKSGADMVFNKFRLGAARSTL